MQIGAVALEELVLGQRQENVEVAGRAAADPGLPLAGEPDPGAVLDSRGNVDRQIPLAGDAPLTRAGRTGVLDHLAAPLAARAGALQREEALRLPYASGAAAGRAGLRLGAGLGPDARAGFAGDRDRDLDLRGLAAKSFLERDFPVVAQVGAALAAATAAALSSHAEQIFENVGKGGGEARAETGAATAAALLEGGMTETVIGGALVPVFQDLVGFVDFLEFDFAGVVPGIAVGVKLHRQLAERRFQDGIVGIAFDFEGFVIAALGGRGHDELSLSDRDSSRSEATSPCNDIGSLPPRGRGLHGSIQNNGWELIDRNGPEFNRADFRRADFQRLLARRARHDGLPREGGGR